LEVLDLHGTVKRAGDGQTIKGATTVRIEERHGRCPASGAEEGIEILRRHGIGREGIRKRRGFEEHLPRLKFPEEPLHSGKLVILVVNMDEVESSLLAVERLDGRDDSPTVANSGEHSWTWNLKGVCGVHCSRVSVKIIQVLHRQLHFCVNQYNIY